MGRYVAIAVGTLAAALAMASRAAAAMPPGGLRGENYVYLKGLGEGSGDKVIPFYNAKRGPIQVILIASRSLENLIVRIEGSGVNDLLVNTIGAYSGITLVPDLRPGSYRIVIQAASDALWGGDISRLLPPVPARPLTTGAFRSAGDWVYQVRVSTPSDPIVTATCGCAENFIVFLRDYYGRAILLFNEVGRYKGQTVVGQALPAGDYLLDVRAQGSWTITFRR